jgi:tripartite-type tricarboxylate transporter receptor subunit TctC
VSLVSTSPHVLFVSSQLPVKTFQEFLDYARARPGRLNYASAGAGGVSHLGMEVILAQAGIQATHVAYRGISQATVDLAAGQVQFMLSSMASLKGLMEKGAVRPIALTSATQAADSRHLPLVSSLLPGAQYTTWYAMYVPVGTGPGGRAGRARAEGQVPRDGHGPAVQHARGADRAHPGGDGAVAQGHRPGRHQR